MCSPDLSTESIAVAQFLDALTEAESRVLFGELDKDGRLVGNGIFTREQVTIFAGIAQCRLPPDDLDQLLAGPNAVTEDQVRQVTQQQVVSEKKYMPLVALVMVRKRKQAEGQDRAQAQAK